VLATIDGPWHPAGDGWSYSNTNYLLLGLLVEAVTGRTLADELRSRFFEPLGLESPRLLTAADPGPLSAAWATVFWGSGATTASAADVALWGDALYGDSSFLDDRLRQQMLAFNDDDYGLGAQRIDLGRVQGIGHTGLLSTYTTLMAHIPRSGVTVALMVNRSQAPLDQMMAADPTDGGPSLMDLVLAAGGG
jgi:D-alanyl-D-alanine carboxypeptidase